MSNVIHVTACDNELIILAFNWNVSYELCRIESGNNNPVDVTIGLVPNAYVGPVNLSGITNPLKDTVTVAIPAGAYTIQVVGVNWGGPTSFKATLNGTAFAGAPTNAVGVVWTPSMPATV